MAEHGNDIDFPSEIQDRLENFHEALMELKETLNPLLNSSLSEVQESLTPLEKAKLHLTTTYTLNALFWMYLNTVGEDPKKHAVKQELDRIKNYMSKAKQIEDKAKASKLNKDAAQRFIRNSLWQPKSEESAQDSAAASNSVATEQNSWVWQSVTPVVPNTAHDLIREWKQDMSDESPSPSSETNEEENRQRCLSEHMAPNTVGSILKEEEESYGSIEESASTPLKAKLKVEPSYETKAKYKKEDSDEATVTKRKRRR